MSSAFRLSAESSSNSFWRHRLQIAGERIADLTRAFGRWLEHLTPKIFPIDPRLKPYLNRLVSESEVVPLALIGCEDVHGTGWRRTVNAASNRAAPVTKWKQAIWPLGIAAKQTVVIQQRADGLVLVPTVQSKDSIPRPEPAIANVAVELNKKGWKLKPKLSSAVSTSSAVVGAKRGGTARSDPMRNAGSARR